MTPPTAGSRLPGPVAIIGGGIGGLTAALSLQHFGVPVRVFEQARALREIGAGVTITPNAMSVLDFLGIGTALAEQAGETPRYFVRSAADGRELERGPDPDSFVPEFGASYRNLHRADLHVTLTEAVTKNDPDAIALDHRFEHLEQDGDQVVAHFSNRASFAAPALIGADGGASAVRNAVFGGQDASYTGHVALRALIPITRVPAAIIADPYALYVGAGRSLIHYPLRHQTTMNLLGNAQASQWQAEGWSIPATVAEFLGLFDDFPEPVRELIAAIPGPDLFKWGLRDREPLPVWSRGRVTMLGDAAHPMTPYLGQGACMAIEDGMVLGRAFGASQDLAEAFSRYEAARRDRANGVQLAARFQGTQHHGSTASGPNSGKTAVTLGLFSYNPVSEPI
jgi:2-polyprenyl-6-methoxyphenol hydroxylase-like FAD-dependent oxidoreductase